MAQKLAKDVVNTIHSLTMRLEKAMELLHLWNNYMEGGISKTEKELVNKTEEFLNCK